MSYIRYIRNYLKGSSANAGNHWVEIKAFDTSGNNIALNKTVTANFTPSSSYKPLTALVDNDIVSGDYIDGNASGVLQYVQIDLGALFNIQSITMWHYYSDSRIYHNNVLQVSTDGNNWITIFDSSINGEYKETSSGYTLQVNVGNIKQNILIYGTYISQSNPDTNYSTDTKYLLGGGNQILFKTDFDKTLGYIKSASLNINVTNITTGGEIEIVKLNSNWDISSVTYNSSPNFDINNIPVNITSTGNQIIDLTNLFKNIYDSNNYGIAIYTNTAQLTTDKNVILTIEFEPTEIILPNVIYSNSVLVNWKPIICDDKYYTNTQLIRDTVSGTGGTIVFQTNDKTVTQYLDTSIQPNINYYYKIFINIYNNSEIQETATLTEFDLNGIKKTQYGYMLSGGIIYFTG